MSLYANKLDPIYRKCTKKYTLIQVKIFPITQIKKEIPDFVGIPSSHPGFASYAKKSGEIIHIHKRDEIKKYTIQGFSLH